MVCVFHDYQLHSLQIDTFVVRGELRVYFVINNMLIFSISGFIISPP